MDLICELACALELIEGPLTHMRVVDVFASNKTTVKGPRVSTSDTWVAPAANPAVLSDRGVAAAASQVASALDTWPSAGVVGAAVQAANVFAVPGPARTSKAVATPLADESTAAQRQASSPSVSATPPDLLHEVLLPSRQWEVTQDKDGWGFEVVHWCSFLLIDGRSSR